MQQYLKALIGPILGALLMAGCERSSSAVASASATLTASPSPISSTSTSIPMSTGTFTAAPVALTPTPTLIPTLVAEQRQDYLVKLLKDNAGCLLPCWWGIVPGLTQWSDAERFLLQIGARASTASLGEDMLFHGTEGMDLLKFNITNSIDFYERAGVVDSIRVHAEGSANPSDFKVIWNNLAPENIASTYGLPTRVWVASISQAGEALGETAPYDLWLVYDTSGFLIRYRGSVRNQPVYRMCPTFDDQGNLGMALDVVLQSPANQQSLESGLVSSPPATLEEAAGLSIEEFYARVSQGYPQACFETPRDFWP